VVEQRRQVVAAVDRVELVQRPVGGELAGGRVLLVDPVNGGRVVGDLVLGEDAGHNDETVPLEVGALLVGHCGARMGTGRDRGGHQGSFLPWTDFCTYDEEAAAWACRPSGAAGGVTVAAPSPSPVPPTTAAISPRLSGIMPRRRGGRRCEATASRSR
jgi:hypothetical protein